MKILRKIVDNGEIVGYEIEDSSFNLPVCKQALFLDMYITPLINEGYKYYGYEANTIEDKNGVPISELPEMSRDEVDELEWAASLDLAMSSALTDAEASKYYTFREESVYNFKTESSYEINTREEFLHYLNLVDSAFYNTSYVSDNRPINFFVNPDALFTIDEILENPESYKRYLDIMVKRHHIRNYGAYQSLVNWLMEQGVLNTSNPSMAEFLTAYYAWGPEGIRNKCTKFEVKLNVDGTFQFMKDPLTNVSADAYTLANRSKKIGVLDGHENAYFVNIKESMNDVTTISDFKRSRLALSSDNQILQMRRLSNTGKKYQPLKVKYSDVSDRLYINLISEGGYTYTYKVSHDKCKLGLAHSTTNEAIFYSEQNFTLASVFPGISFPIDCMDNATDYYLWNLALIKAVEITKSKTTDVPVKSTSDFLLNDGVNPIATIDMICRSISKNREFVSNRRYPISDNSDGIGNALELYLQDLPDYLLAAYNLTEEDLENGITSFLELADVDDLRDRREQMMEQKIVPGQQGFDETFKDYYAKYAKNQNLVNQVNQLVGRSTKKYDAVDYYTKLRFVYDCLHGQISVDNFGDGNMSDLGADYLSAAECIMSIVYAEKGTSPSKEDGEDIIHDLGTNNLIDLNQIFKMRDNAYKGYMVDFAKYRNTRACTNTWVWAYCTKVFREISNAPIEKQRPYLMELVVVENSKPDLVFRNFMTDLIKESIEKMDFSVKPYEDYGSLVSWNEKKCAMESADWIAAKLFFFILAGGVKTEPVNGVYKISIDMYDSKNLDVEVPTEVYDIIRSFNKDTHKKYITVYDFCKYEYNPNTATGTFNFCLVNASVDPWHVKPKKGYAIKSYPLLPNYYTQDALDKSNGVGFYQGAYDSKAICVQPLKVLYKDSFIPTSEITETMMWEKESQGAMTPDDLMPFLDPEQYEYIFAYVRRWALERKYARSIGKKLVSIPLKQDIVYAPLATSYCEEAPSTTPVYSDDINLEDRSCQFDTKTTSISWRQFDEQTKLLEGGSTSIREFSIDDWTVEEASAVSDLIMGSASTVPMTVTGNYLNIQGDSMIRIAVSRLTSTQIEEFASSGVFRRLGTNKYFINAINGYFVLEVL